MSNDKPNVIADGQFVHKRNAGERTSPVSLTSFLMNSTASFACLLITKNTANHNQRGQIVGWNGEGGNCLSARDPAK